MRQILVTAVNESYETEMEGIRCPVSLIWGSDDAEVPPPVAEKAASILRRSGARVELTILDGVGHFVPTERPDVLASAVIARLGDRR
jgi:pimeloyl-ACP methyl ester carboxylesterase